MSDLTRQFLDFCRSKPADEEYNFYREDACAFYQFAVACGIPHPVRGAWDDADNRPGVPGLPKELRTPLVRGHWSFGALADRLEAQLARETTDA